MREDFWTFKPTHKLCFARITSPGLRGPITPSGDGWFSAFEQKFWNPAAGESGPPELVQDKSLAQKLSAEREGSSLGWSNVALSGSGTDCRYRMQSKQQQRPIEARTIRSSVRLGLLFGQPVCACEVLKTLRIAHELVR